MGSWWLGDVNRTPIFLCSHTYLHTTKPPRSYKTIWKYSADAPSDMIWICTVVSKVIINKVRWVHGDLVMSTELPYLYATTLIFTLRSLREVTRQFESIQLMSLRIWYESVLLYPKLSSIKYGGFMVTWWCQPNSHISMQPYLFTHYEASGQLQDNLKVFSWCPFGYDINLYCCIRSYNQ